MKQVIVMRTDLRNTEGHKVRTGKLIAQGAHASLGAVLPYVRHWDGEGMASDYMRQADKVNTWLAGSFTKIVLGIGGLDELRALESEAIDAGLINYLIIDNGTTEFGGVPTVTCLAIGPDTKENIDQVTGKLKSY